MNGLKQVGLRWAIAYRGLVTDPAGPRAIVLVEGVSDQLALEALGRRRGLNLEAEGVSIAPMGVCDEHRKLPQSIRSKRIGRETRGPL